VAHTFNPKQHLEGRGRRISEFEASLVYTVSSRTARAIQRNPVSKKPKKKKKKGHHQVGFFKVWCYSSAGRVLVRHTVCPGFGSQHPKG
jgi:hypothetical protein